MAVWVKFGVGNEKGVGDAAPGRVHDTMLDASMKYSSRRADFRMCSLRQGERANCFRLYNVNSCQETDLNPSLQ